MKSITVEWRACTPEARLYFGYAKEMIVIKSDHPIFLPNTRFDFGFLSIASSEGYVITINPLKS